MRKVVVIALALGLSASVAATAWAGGWGMRGGGYGAGGGYYQNLTPAQQAQVDKARAQFLQETLTIRQNIASKNAELRTLIAQPNADQGRIKALSDELVDLRTQLAKKGNEYAAQMPAGTGMGWRGGMGGGPRWGY